MSIHSPGYLKVPEAARYANVSDSTIVRWIECEDKEKRLPAWNASRPGSDKKSYRVHSDDLDEFIKKRQT